MRILPGIRHEAHCVLLIHLCFFIKGCYGDCAHRVGDRPGYNCVPLIHSEKKPAYAYVDEEPKCYCDTPLCNHKPDNAPVKGSSGESKKSLDNSLGFFLVLLMTKHI